MKNKSVDYLFVDPLPNKENGISRYIEECNFFFMNMGYTTRIIKKEPREEISYFIKRINLFIREFSVKVVEVPETGGLANGIIHNKIHIRLHGSKSVCNYFQGKKIPIQSIFNEKLALQKAFLVSSPSAVNLKAFSMFDNNIESKTLVIPNPIRLNLDQIKEQPCIHKRQVFFIGRGDFLKGIEFLTEIIILCDDIHFTLIGNRKLQSFISSSDVKEDNFTFIDGYNKNFLGLLNKGDIVIIPSLFESWSIVASEAVSHGCFVIIWNHLGICEFLFGNFIKKIPAWNIQNFVEALREIYFSNNSIDIDEIKQNIEIINSNYKELIKYLMGEQDISFYNFNYSEYSKKILLPTPQYERIDIMARLKRKIIKLFKNPQLFFKDSHFYSSIKKINNYNNIISNTNNKNIQQNFNKNIMNTQNKKLQNWKELTLSPSGFFTFPEVDEKHSELRTIILISEKFKYIVDIEKLAFELYKNTDFFPLREKELLLYWVPDSVSNYTIDELFLCLNIKNRERLSNIRNIFIYDDNQRLASALHYSNYKIRVIQIYHYDTRFIHPSDLSDDIYGYIIPENLAGQFNTNRKYLQYKNLSELALMIRKNIQEMIPIDLNLLLPVISGYEYNPVMFDLSIKEKNISDIYIKLDKKVLDKLGALFSHTEICQNMAINTKELFVKEKIFLRYQNLLANPIEENIEKFYLLASRDGLYFTVEYN